MKTLGLAVVIFLQCLASIANDDTFFGGLDLRTRDLGSLYQEQSLKTILGQVYDWLTIKSELTESNRQLLQRAFSHLENVVKIHSPSDRRVIAQVLNILKESEPGSDNSRTDNGKKSIEQLLKTRLSNTWSGCLPKDLQDLCRKYLTFSEIFRLQKLSKGSLKETAARISADFPDVNLPFSEAPHSALTSLSGYSTLTRYKETVFPLEAIRLAMHYVLSSRSKEDEKVLRSKLAKLSSSLNPQTLGFRFISNLRAITRTDRPYIDPSIINAYELLADAGHPYAIEIYGLLQMFQTQSLHENPPSSLAAYFEKQPLTPGLLLPKKEDLKLAPTARQLLSFLQNRSKRDELENQYDYEPLEAKRTELATQIGKLFEKIAKDPWANCRNKRDAFEWFSERQQHYKKASYWADIIAREPNATMSDKSFAALAARKDENLKLALYWSEIVAQSPDASCHNITAAAQIAYDGYLDRQKALLQAPSTESETIIDYREQIRTELPHFAARATHWAGLINVSNVGDIDAQRLAAQIFNELGNSEQGLHWLKVVSEHQRATANDRSAYEACLAKQSTSHVGQKRKRSESE